LNPNFSSLPVAPAEKKYEPLAVAWCCGRTVE
jgi:hypothetical protein